MLASAVWIGPAIFAAINQVAQRRLHGEPPARLRDLLWSAGDWLVYALLTPAIFWVSNRWPITRPRMARRTALHLATSLLFSAAWAVGGKMLQALLAFTLSRDEAKSHDRDAARSLP
jgi:hypothetical protein